MKRVNQARYVRAYRVSGKQPLFSVGHWQNVCKKLAGILIFFYLEENRSNKSDELAGSLAQKLAFWK